VDNLLKLKLKKLLLTIVLLGLFALNIGAEGDRYIKIVKKGLSIGDVRSMSKLFDRTIDITFSDNKATTYSKNQASVLLKKFFAKSTAKNFILQHQGKSHTNNTLYAIGTLYTKSANYRVYLFFIPKSEEYLLKELRFERL
jgi:hypothetical protein